MASIRICFLCAILLATAFLDSAEAADIRVGGTAGWIIQPYSPINASVGDTLIFTYAEGAHDVQIFPSATAFTNCNFTGATVLPYVGTGSSYTIGSANTIYFGCSIGQHCVNGQKVSVSAAAATTTAAPPPPLASNTMPSYKAVICWSTRFGTGCVPSNYSTSPAATTVYTPGSLVAFNFSRAFHDLYTVSTLAEFDACNFTAGRLLYSQDANITTPDLYPVNLTSPVTYFLCSVQQHCSLGQKIALRTSSSSSGTSPPTVTSSPPIQPSARPPPPKPSSASKLMPATVVLTFVVALGLHLL